MYIEWFSPAIIEDVVELIHYCLSFAAHTDSLYGIRNISVLMNNVILTMLKIIVPIISVAMVTGLVCSYMQVGVMFTTKTLQVKLDKLNPISGFKRLFSLRSVVELVKAVSKAAMMIYISFSYLKKEQGLLVNLFDMSIELLALIYGVLVLIF